MPLLGLPTLSEDEFRKLKQISSCFSLLEKTITVASGYKYASMGVYTLQLKLLMLVLQQRVQDEKFHKIKDLLEALKKVSASCHEKND